MRPGWKGRALLSICVFVPGGTEGHLHASLLIMGMFISPWGAAPVSWLFARTGTAGLTQAPQSEGRKRRAIPADDTGEEKVSILVCLMAPPTGMWSHGAHHPPTNSFHFPGVSRGACAHVAPKLGDLFFSRWIVQRVLAQPCLFLLGTKCIPYFCIWTLEESSSPGNPAIEANLLPVLLDPSQFRM